MTFFLVLTVFVLIAGHELVRQYLDDVFHEDR